MLNRRYILGTVVLALWPFRRNKVLASEAKAEGLCNDHVLMPDTDWVALSLASSRYLTIPAFIDGNALPAIIDTGSTRNVVSAAWAARLNLPISGALTATTFTQKVSGTLYRVEKLSAANLTVHDVDILCIGSVQAPETPIHDPPLLLGSDFIEQGILEIDFPKARGRFLPRDCPHSTESGTVIMVTKSSGNIPLIPVEIENNIKAEAIVDLGSNVTCMMSEEFARIHGLLEGRVTSTTMTAGVDGPEISAVVSLRRIAIGPYTLYNVPACIISDWHLERPVNLGWTCFASFRFILNLARASLTLDANVELLKQPLARDRSGIGAIRLTDRLSVVHVAKASPAQLAGLREGDTITAIDGRQIDANYPAAGERMGYKPSGTRIRLTLADGRALTIVLADYF